MVRTRANGKWNYTKNKRGWLLELSDTDHDLLSEQLKQLGFSTDISIPASNKDSLIAHYKNIRVVSPFYKESLPKITSALERNLSNVGVDQKTAHLFTTSLLKNFS